MIAFLVRYFLGSVWICCDADRLLAVLDQMMRDEIFYDGLHLDKEGGGHFRLYPSDARRLFASLTEREGIKIEKEEGLPPILRRYQRRWGIPIGMLLLCLILYLSSNVIWSMEIRGNETVSDVEIKEGLGSLGCRVGSFIPAMDLWQVCNRYLLMDGRLAFLSVNLEGTHAVVEVMEEKQKQQSDWEHPNDDTPSNLVATSDGQIVRYEISSGQAAVKVHQVVKKGELLVSGIVNTKKNPDNTFRLERSVARVYAQTVKEFSVSQPLLTQQTVEIEKEITEKSIIFFSQAIKLFKKGGKTPEGYDIIRERTQWTLFENISFLPTISLPIYTETVTVVRTQEREERIDQTRGREMASRMLAQSVALALLPDAQTVSYQLQEGYDEGTDSYTMTLRLTCIENIAREVPITIDGIGQISP